MQIQMEYRHYQLVLLVQIIIRRLMLGVADEDDVVVVQKKLRNV